MIEAWLRKHFRFKEIGWEDIGERFTRYAILKNRWFALYLHQLNCMQWHPKCHDHPWWFVTLLLWPGYLEETKNAIRWRWPGMILYRAATFSHNVVTPKGTSWSLVLTGPKSRDWGFNDCRGEHD